MKVRGTRHGSIVYTDGCWWMLVAPASPSGWWGIATDGSQRMARLRHHRHTWSLIKDRNDMATAASDGGE